MNAIRHLKILIGGISGRIESYTSDPLILNYLTQLKQCDDNVERETILYCLNSILSWYNDEMDTISRKVGCGFDAHKNNKKTIECLIQEIESEKEIASKGNDKAILEKVFTKFDKVYRQLQVRYNGRTTLQITDEYDVQDLLHSLLVLFFEDIRPEESSPSYAGAASRMDFLLKESRTVIEVKKTRPSMRDSSLGEQLIADCAKYRKHPDCDTLYCFVFDPDHYLSNPIGLINDLEEESAGFMRVFIEPK